MKTIAKSVIQIQINYHLRLKTPAIQTNSIAYMAGNKYIICNLSLNIHPH